MKSIFLLTLSLLLVSCSTVMIEYAKVGNVEKMQEHYKKEGKYVLTQNNESGEVPIVSAAEYGHINAIKFLIDNGVSINMPDLFKHDNSLSAAARKGDLKTIQYLLENGADPKAEYSRGWSAIRAAKYEKQFKAVNLMENFKEVRKNTIKIKKDKQSKLAHENQFTKAKKANHYSLYDRFLQEYPDSRYRSVVLKKMANLINRNSQGSQIESFLQKYPKGSEYLRPGPWLLKLGPNGLKVKDLIMKIKEGMSKKILVAKIKNSNITYKDFTFKEMKYLKKRGVDDMLIEAMLEVTGSLLKEQKRALESKKLLSEIQKLIDQSQKNVMSNPKRTNKGEGIGKVASDCVKLSAALKACDNAPGFLSMACKATARSQFNCSM